MAEPLNNNDIVNSGTSVTRWLPFAEHRSILDLSDFNNLRPSDRRRHSRPQILSQIWSWLRVTGAAKADQRSEHRKGFSVDFRPDPMYVNNKNDNHLNLYIMSTMFFSKFTQICCSCRDECELTTFVNVWIVPHTWVDHFIVHLLLEYAFHYNVHLYNSNFSYNEYNTFYNLHLYVIYKQLAKKWQTSFWFF